MPNWLRLIVGLPWVIGEDFVELVRMLAFATRGNNEDPWHLYVRCSIRLLRFSVWCGVLVIILGWIPGWPLWVRGWCVLAPTVALMYFGISFHVAFAPLGIGIPAVMPGNANSDTRRYGMAVAYMALSIATFGAVTAIVPYHSNPKYFWVALLSAPAIGWYLTLGMGEIGRRAIAKTGLLVFVVYSAICICIAIAPWFGKKFPLTTSIVGNVPLDEWISSAIAGHPWLLAAAVMVLLIVLRALFSRRAGTTEAQTVRRGGGLLTLLWILALVILVLAAAIQVGGAVNEGMRPAVASAQARRAAANAEPTPAVVAPVTVAPPKPRREFLTVSFRLAQGEIKALELGLEPDGPPVRWTVDGCVELSLERSPAHRFCNTSSLFIPGDEPVMTGVVETATVTLEDETADPKGNAVMLSREEPALLVKIFEPWLATVFWRILDKGETRTAWDATKDDRCVTVIMESPSVGWLYESVCPGDAYTVPKDIVRVAFRSDQHASASNPKRVPIWARSWCWECNSIADRDA